MQLRWSDWRRRSAQLAVVWAIRFGCGLEGMKSLGCFSRHYSQKKSPYTDTGGPCFRCKTACSLSDFVQFGMRRLYGTA